MFDPQAAKERCEAASETPWTVGNEPQLNMVAECGDTRNGLSLYVFAYRLAPAEADAEFIAHARSDLPAALEALEEAQAEHKALRQLGIEMGVSSSVAVQEFLTRLDAILGES